MGYELWANVYLTRIQPNETGELEKAFTVTPVFHTGEHDNRKSYWVWVGCYRWQSWVMGGWEWRPNQSEPAYNLPKVDWIEQHAPALPDAALFTGAINHTDHAL